MSTIKYTLGPWRNEGWNDLVVNSFGGNTIVCCPGGSPGANLVELQANARLIAASPSLLSVALEIYNLDRDAGGNVTGPVWRAMVARISKKAQKVISDVQGKE